MNTEYIVTLQYAVGKATLTFQCRLEDDSGTEQFPGITRDILISSANKMANEGLRPAEPLKWSADRSLVRNAKTGVAL